MMVDQLNYSPLMMKNMSLNLGKTFLVDKFSINLNNIPMKTKSKLNFNDEKPSQWTTLVCLD